MRLRTGTVLLLAILQVAPAAMAARAPAEFEGRLVPSGPVLFSGQVDMDGARANTSATWGLSPAHAPLFHFGDNATRIAVKERRDGAMGTTFNRLPRPGGLPDPTPSYLAGSVTTRTYEFPAHDLDILPLPSTRLTLPIGGHDRVQFPNHARFATDRCEILREPHRERGLWPGNDPKLLRATCATAGVDVASGSRLEIANATLVVRYFEVENGTRHERRIEIHAGPFVEPDPYVPNRTQAGFRSVTLYLVQADAAMAMEGRELVVRSPALALPGRLSFPPSTGVTRWAGQSEEGSLSPLVLEGAAVMRPDRDSGEAVHVQALTTNLPDGLPESAANPAPLPATKAIVAAGLLALLAAAAWKTRFLWLGLFTRIDEDALLGHERRRLLLQAVEQHPGITVGDAATLLGLSRSVVQHHVIMLARSGALVRNHVGRLTALFLPAHAPRERPRLQLLRNPLVRQLLETLRADPELSQVQIGERLSISQAHVSRLLRRIRQVGLELPGASPATPKASR